MNPFGLLVSFCLALMGSVHSEAQSRQILTFQSEKVQFSLDEIFQANDVIWSFQFLPDRRILFAEKKGRLRIVDPTTRKIEEVLGVPAVDADGQGGLLDVALHPKFADNNLVYFSYSSPEGKKSTTAVARAVLKDNRLQDLKVLFKAEPFLDSSMHFGSRLVFDGKGHFFVTVGERNERDYAQKLDGHLGKVVRLKEDGSVPADNPFVGKAKVKPEIWSYGHRNQQGLVWRADLGELWVIEHGPRGGDEINIAKSGLNFGWPKVTLGREYWGPSIGVKEKAGMESPWYSYVPSIAPSNGLHYSGSEIKPWQGDLLIGALVLTHLNRLDLKDGRVVKEERLLKDWGQRIRDVRQGPDGLVYLATDSGILARIRPL
jgi:glucose/arabinose dehydrogenase